MGTILARSIIERAQIILQDTTGVRWPADSELLGWLNDGQREVVIFKPNSCVRNQAVRLVGGSLQSLPSDGVQLIDIPRNLGTNGSTPGRPVRIVLREMLDAQTPNWHSMPTSAEVRHYTYSPLDPNHFYVYPPQPASNPGYVEMIYGASPVNAMFNGPIALDDIYQNVLLDYILYRAYSKDAEYAANPQRAQAHQNAYLAALTGKTQGEALVTPTPTPNPR